MRSIPWLVVVAAGLAIAMVVVYIRMAGKKAAAKRDEKYYREVERLDEERRKSV